MRSGASVRIPAAAALALVVACAGPGAARPGDGWQALERALPLLGHRNWIAVVDSAYPAQAGSGVETEYVGGDQVEAVARVLRAVDAAPHVRAVAVLDQELEHVPEAAAPGIAGYRERLGGLLAGRPVERLPHGDVIRALEEAAGSFRVLVLKTDMALPYTSVFLRLECGYWGAESEQALRRAMGAGSAEGR